MTVRLLEVARGGDQNNSCCPRPAVSLPTRSCAWRQVPLPLLRLCRAPGEPGPASPTEERFLAFGRVFSGVLRAGAPVHVLPPSYNPADPASEAQQAQLGALYLMMGRGLERLQVGGGCLSLFCLGGTCACAYCI